nr:hypothetical protein [Tanacetum cinerariifolium]
MDKGVANIVQDHKRKHDDNEDDDDEDPLAGPNQGKQTMRRRTKYSESLKKPSTTKETPKGKAPSKASKTGKSDPAKESVEEPIAEVVMDDAGDDVVHDDDQPQDTSEPMTTKTLNLDWFKQPLRPPIPDLKWNKRQVVLDKPEQPWFNQMVSTTKDPLTFDDLMATLIDFSKYCFNALTDMLDWNNPEGDRYPVNLSKPLPLQGHPGHLTVDVDYFFKHDLEYLKSFNPERMYTTLITKTKATRYEIEGIEDMSVSVKKLHGFGHLEEIMVKRADYQFYKFKEDGMLKKVWDELHHKIRDFRLEYNTEMPRRKWMAIDKKRSELMIELIDKQMRERRIIQNLERLVGARELEMDYKLMTRTI